MSKYLNLVNVLDQIRFEAPSRYTRYRPAIQDLEKINQARSRALIHLFLKVSLKKEKELLQMGVMMAE